MQAKKVLGQVGGPEQVEALVPKVTEKDATLMLDDLRRFETGSTDLGGEAGYEAASMLAHMKGIGFEADARPVAGMIADTIRYYGPQQVLSLGAGTDAAEADELFKSIGLILRRPPAQSQQQYSVSSVNQVAGEADTWKVTATLPDADNPQPREWTLTRQENKLLVDGSPRRELTVEENSDGVFTVYRTRETINVLVLHSLAKTLGVPTEITGLQTRLFGEELDSYRRRGDIENALLARYHMRNIGIDTEPSERMEDAEQALKKARREKNAAVVANILMFGQALGLDLKPEEKDRELWLNELAIARGEKRRSRDLDLATDGWLVSKMHYVFRKIYGSGPEQELPPPI